MATNREQPEHGRQAQERPPERHALRVHEFCRAFGICKATFYNYKRDGLIRTVRIAGVRLVPADAVAEFLGGGAP